MNFVHLAPGVGSTRGLVVALGTFDGVHVGHRAIVAAAKKESTVLGTDTAVLIFSASPHGAGCILPLDDRLREFRALGVNLAVVCDFEELRTLTPEAFVSEILLGKLGAAAVFAGYNYRFGAKAAGDTDRLRALCAAHGITCGVTPCVELDGAPVSSTRIRALLAAGDVEAANRLLGYRYYLRGTERAHARYADDQPALCRRLHHPGARRVLYHGGDRRPDLPRRVQCRYAADRFGRERG